MPDTGKRRRPAGAGRPQRKKRKIIGEDGKELKPVPITQDNAREADETVVDPGDSEVGLQVVVFGRA
jgi:hypothetical protein